MERSAQIQNTHLNLGRELSSMAAKLRYGVSEHGRLQTSEAKGRVGSPVDRDSEERLQEPERLGGADRGGQGRAKDPSPRSVPGRYLDRVQAWPSPRRGRCRPRSRSGASRGSGNPVLPPPFPE